MQTLRLAIIVQGGLVRAVGYDYDGKPVRIETQVIDYDCPRGAVLAQIPQSDGSRAKAMVYPAEARFVPDQIGSVFEAAAGAQAERQAADERKPRVRRAAARELLPVVAPPACVIPAEYAGYMHEGEPDILAGMTG